MLTWPGATALDTTGPLEVFSTADQLVRRRSGENRGIYQVSIAAPESGAVQMESGISVVADHAFSRIRGSVDTLLIAGGTDVVRSDFLAQFQSMTQRIARCPARRVCSICTGTVFLAEAGLLNGRRAATHWAYADLLAKRYPQVTVDRDAIYVKDGPIYTSAGVTSGIDLALALVEEDHGHALAMDVARMLVVFLKRPGGQSQFSHELQTQTSVGGGPLDDLLQYIADHPDSDLSCERLAEWASMSLRSFFRVFERETGQTPATYVRHQRLAVAQRLLESTDGSVEDIACRCGFGHGDRLRRTFERQLGISPTAYRERFGERRTTS